MTDTTIDLTQALTIDEHAALCAALKRELELLQRPSPALADHWPVFKDTSQRILEAEYLRRAMRKMGVTRCS